MRTVSVYNVGNVGVIKDISPHLLPPEAWSDASNVRFTKKGAEKLSGYTQVFGTPLYAPSFVMNIPNASESYWIYCSLTKAAVYNANVHTNITRQTASVDVNYTATEATHWQSTILGGIPILNNRADVPQYWTAINPSNKLADMTAWPSTLRAKLVKSFGRFLLAMNITESGAASPHAIRWSHSADPGSLPSSWDDTDPELDAGRLQLTDIQGGEIVAAELLGNTLVVYKENSTHVLRQVQSNDIFAPDMLLATSGALSSKSVTAIDNGRRHFVVTQDDIIVHAGTKEAPSVVDEKNREFIFNDIDIDTSHRAFCFDNAPRKEAWFCYPSKGSLYPDKAFIYKYGVSENRQAFAGWKGYAADVGKLDITTPATWSSITGSWESQTDSWGKFAGKSIVFCEPNDNKLYSLDRSSTFDGANITSSLTRSDLAIIGRDRENQPKVDYRVRKIVSRFWPKVDGNCILRIQVGAAEEFHEAVTWSAIYEFDPLSGLPYIDFDPPVNGRLLSIRIQSDGEGEWVLEGYDIEMELLGNL